ncbi:MAG: ABC transporter permease [Bacteroidetes bacterium]|nr:ABC transporter permease [Bacteroidota bacterium]MBS1672082.1 ABC transporter permease [Bacteroidota bacterium]
MNLLFAWRYFKSKKTTNAINIIARISVIAIAVGTTALIIVLSVFNGFEDLVKGLYADFYADIKVSPVKGKTIILTPEQINQLKNINGITQTSLVAEEKALLVNGDNQAIVYVKGVDDNYTNTSNMLAHIVRGKFVLGNIENPKLVIGAGIENAAGIDVERSLTSVNIYLPDRKAKNLLSPENLTAYTLQPSGTFLVQQDFDNKYVFTNLAFAKFMLGLNANEYTSVDIKTNNNSNKVKTQIQKILGTNYLVQTRYEQNQSLYMVMNIEKWVIYAILSLILIVAAFNIIGALTMLVIEKEKDIAVLKAMGANNKKIQSIFLFEGILLASIGGISGILLASVICFLQMQFHLIKLSGGSFIIDYYPVQLNIFDFVLVAVTVLIIAILAAFIPAKKASMQEFSLKS